MILLTNYYSITSWYKQFIYQGPWKAGTGKVAEHHLWRNYHSNRYFLHEFRQRSIIIRRFAGAKLRILSVRPARLRRTEPS